jgi:tape measure domain-containing protein
LATTYAVDLKFGAQTRELDASVAKLNNVERAAKQLQGTVNNTKLDALTGALNVLPGGANAAANGILGFTNRVKDLKAQSKAAAAEVVAMQAAINSKRVQLGAKGGIGGEAIKREIEQMEAALAGAKGSLSGMGATAGLAAVAVAGVAAAAVAVVSPMVRFTNEVDRNRQQLTLFTKDIKVTNQIIASLQKTADATSLGLPGLLEATKTLSAYGIEAQNAGAAVKMLGDLALGDQEKLSRFAVNFAQIASLGKAYTVDLKQFGMAGIPIFDALSKVTGKSTAEIMKMAEEGRITYPLVVKALQDLTKEGASFYKGAERGGTNLDRSLNQLQGSWEKLSQIIGATLTPTVTEAINVIKDLIDSWISGIDQMGRAYDRFLNNFKGKTPEAIKGQIDQIDKYIQNNEKQLEQAGEGATARQLQRKVDELKKLKTTLEDDLANFGKPKQAGGKNDDLTERAKLAADAEAKAKAEAQDAVAKLRKSEAEKIAEIELNKARSLADARLGYERELADFRVSQIERIATLERQLNDERVQAEFKLAQAREELLGGQRQFDLTADIISARAQGKDTTALEGAKEADAFLTASARKRAEIQFSAATRSVELERRLSDFKRESQRQLGQMQLAYSRQTEDIIRQAGTAVADEMVKGAKAAKEILESVNMTPGSGGAGDTYEQPGVGTFSRSTGRLVAAAGGAGGKIVEHLHGDPGRAGYDRRGHGTEANAHDHFAFDSEATTKKVMEGLKKLGYTITEFGVKSGHATNSLHYDNRAFDVPWSQFGSGPIGQGDFNKSRQLRKDVERLLGGSMPAASTVASNNIVPTARPQAAPAGIPVTSPGLEDANKKLEQFNQDQKRLELLRLEQEGTQQLADKVAELTLNRADQLRTMQQSNQLELQTLELMRSGISPELAKQLATNQQFVANYGLQLEKQKAILEAAVQEKDITTKTREERQKLLDLVNGQIQAQPGLLDQLNQEATQTQALSDQRNAQEQAKSDAQSISSSITGGLKDVLKAAITGGDMKQALAGMLSNIGDRLLDIAMRPLEDMLTKSLTNMFSPQQVATQANTAALMQLTVTLQSAAMTGAAGGAGGFSPLGILGSVFSVAGGAFGGGAFGSGFNPLSTTKLFPGGIFEGGGYTGDAPRAGGMDGKGGFPAILHPGETVTDHRASSARSALNGGGGGENVSVTYSGPQLNFNGDEYLPKSAVNDIINSASRRGAAMGTKQTMDRLRQSPQTRRSLGI